MKLFLTAIEFAVDVSLRAGSRLGFMREMREQSFGFVRMWSFG